MKISEKAIFSRVFIFVAFAMLGPIFVMAQSFDPETSVPTIKPPSTVNVSNKGEVKITNAVVFMIRGSTLFVRTYWDESFIRWTVRINDKTEILKKFGGVTKVADIKVGFVINAQGTMVAGADSLNIDATVIRVLDLENESGSFTGVVMGIDNSGKTLIMRTDDKKDITVKISSDTIIKKGSISVPFSKISYGDRILTAVGSFHQPTQTIAVTNIEIGQNKKIFSPRNFEGVLEKLNSKTLPTTAVFVIGGTKYTAYLSTNTEVLRKSKSKTNLERFVDGDKVRIYGAIRETIDQNEIDAEVIRDMDL